MKLRQLQKAATKSSAQAKAAKNRFELLADHAKAARELVKAVKIRFKVTRKALKQAKKNARLSLVDKKQAGKELKRTAALVEKYEKRLRKLKRKGNPAAKSRKEQQSKVKISVKPSGKKVATRKKAGGRSRAKLGKKKAAALKGDRFIALRSQPSSPETLEHSAMPFATADSAESTI